MKEKIYFKILLYIVFITYDCNAIDFSITIPGIYKLGDFLNSNTTTNPDSIISIQANNVVLDLGGYVVQQNTTTVGVSGITVGSGLTNITIKNGIIQNTTQDGIVVSSSSNIYLQNLIIQNCARTGINASGVTNLSIDNCIINNCATGSTGTTGIAIISGSLECRIFNTIIKNCGNPANTFFGVNLDVTQADLANVLVEECVASIAGLFGFQIGVNTQFSTFTNCIINNCTAGAYIGFFLNGANAFGNIFINCKCTSLIANASSNCFGFSISSSQNIFKNCLVSDSSSLSTLLGFSVNTAGSNANELIDCVAKDNTAATTMHGFDLQNCDSGLLVRCIATNNTATGAGSSSAGLQATTINFWEFQDCEFYRNVGIGNSFGTAITSSLTTNLFSKTIAFNNGTVAANQLNGVPAGSQASNTSTTINSFTAAWNNLAIPT